MHQPWWRRKQLPSPWSRRIDEEEEEEEDSPDERGEDFFTLLNIIIKNYRKEMSVLHWVGTWS